MRRCLLTPPLCSPTPSSQTDTLVVPPPGGGQVQMQRFHVYTMPLDVYPTCALCLDYVCIYADMLCKWSVCYVYMLFVPMYIFDVVSLGHNLLFQSAGADMS